MTDEDRTAEFLREIATRLSAAADVYDRGESVPDVFARFGGRQMITPREVVREASSEAVRNLLQLLQA